ncbi:hypothetical protein NA57DRAFT_81009 [Rhizodiscina lignyota]|uniref:Uncharacterized protein n=1 Tax=Rhizodiscina lignyota TaxID=1504668 RepID=A0A9P4I928_9PEZI|nr:hypothetical protein NA57DRAFT_81009 [Rhizodiscina lignyota]
MTIDWKTAEALERFLVSWWMIGPKPDLKKLAEAYGNGATYHTMEGFSRKIKAKVEARKREIEEAQSSGGQASPAPVKRARKSKTTDGVVSGRVEKTSPSKRSLQRSATFVKTESSQASTNGALQTPALTPGSTSDALDISFTDDMTMSFEFDGHNMANLLDVGHANSFHTESF